MYFSNQTEGKNFAKGNYAGFPSPIHITHLEYFPGALGGFKPGSKLGQKSRRVQDTTKTLLASEVRTRADLQDQRGAWALPWSGASLISPDVHQTSMPSVGLHAYLKIPYDPGASPEDDENAQTPNKQIHIFDVVYSCQVAASLLDKMPCSQYGGANGGFWSAAPRSLHAGGVNVVCLDGHVGFVADEIHWRIFAYLVSTRDTSSGINIDEYVQ
jgi:hypothetical protein